MSTEDETLQPLEAALLRAMKAIDNQVAREMQRTPAEREEHGSKKWKPYDTRIENIAAFVLNSLGDDSATLDSVIVLSQAFTKALRMAMEDLGPDGLGKIRTEYCSQTMERIQQDAVKGRAAVVEESGKFN